MNKKGLSDVVSIIIIILLIMVALGIIWYVVRPLIDQGLGGAQSGISCMDLDLTIEDVTCSTGITTIKITRSNDKQEISKMNVKFYNDIGSKIISSEEYIGPGETVSFEFENIEIGFAPTKVSVFATLLDEGENEIQCEESAKFDTDCNSQSDKDGDGIPDYEDPCPNIPDTELFTCECETTEDCNILFPTSSYTCENNKCYGEQ